MGVVPCVFTRCTKRFQGKLNTQSAPCRLFWKKLKKRAKFEPNWKFNPLKYLIEEVTKDLPGLLFSKEAWFLYRAKKKIWTISKIWKWIQQDALKLMNTIENCKWGEHTGSVSTNSFVRKIRSTRWNVTMKFCLVIIFLFYPSMMHLTYTRTPAFYGIQTHRHFDFFK